GSHRFAAPVGTRSLAHRRDGTPHGFEHCPGRLPALVLECWHPAYPSLWPATSAHLDRDHTGTAPGSTEATGRVPGRACCAPRTPPPSHPELHNPIAAQPAGGAVGSVGTSGWPA